MRTALATDCDPACKARKSVDALAQHYDELVMDVRWNGGTNEGYKQAVAEGEHIRQNYRGTATLAAIGETCSLACAIERFSDDYDDFVAASGVQFGNEVEIVIKHIKDR